MVQRVSSLSPVRVSAPSSRSLIRPGCTDTSSPPPRYLRHPPSAHLRPRILALRARRQRRSRPSAWASSLPRSYMSARSSTTPRAGSRTSGTSCTGRDSLRMDCRPRLREQVSRGRAGRAGVWRRWPRKRRTATARTHQACRGQTQPPPPPVDTITATVWLEPCESRCLRRSRPSRRVTRPSADRPTPSWMRSRRPSESGTRYVSVLAKL